MSNLAVRNNNNQIVERKVESGPVNKRGGFYTVAGKKEADSWRVQEEANDKKISTEIIEAEQTNEYAKAIVRAYYPDKAGYVEAVVHHDFKTVRELRIIDMLDKELEAVSRGSKPRIFKDPSNPFIWSESGEMIPNLTSRGQLHIMKTMLRFKQFSLRDATTKAMRIAQLKALNQEWREAEEIEEERKEVEEVAKDIAEKQGRTAKPKPVEVELEDPSENMKKVIEALEKEGKEVSKKSLFVTAEQLMQEGELSLAEVKEIKRELGFQV